MMSIKEKVDAIAKACDNDELEFINFQFDRIPKYHNCVVDMEKSMSFQRFRLEPEDFRDWLENANRNRIMCHKGMIDAICIINRFCKSKGIDPIYDGYIDDAKRYDDPDTRFGIADFSDRYCSEMFNAGQGERVS